MRQRYYNPEIKRFVNQDILTGSIGNSQSLNRYSYVQGNPVSYTDPFGLSPLNGLFSGTMLIHTVCGLLGWIPGPVGAIANAVDGLVYLFVDKDYKNAFYSLGTAVTFGAGKIVAAVGKGSKTALNIQRGCNAIGNGINFLQSAEGTYQTASMMVDKYIVQGQPFSGSTVLEVALLGANMFGAYKSGTYVGNDIADFGCYLKRSWNARNATNTAKVDTSNGKEPFVKMNLQFFASKTSYGKSSGNLGKPKGWKVGDPIDNLTKAGNEPSWSTVKSRYWKNEAFYNSDLYSARNMEFMKKGKAPHYDEIIDVPKELHHINGRKIDNPHNINNLKEVWPWKHADIDIFRHYNGPRP